jgi:hypothetical protein
MLRTCRYTCRRAAHIRPICTAESLTYRKVHSHVLTRLSNSNHAACCGMVGNPRACDPSAGHQLMDCACRRRRGYHHTRRHRTNRNVGNDHIDPKLRSGWTIYGALLLMYLLILLLLPLEAELSISKVLLPFTHQQACISYLRKKLSSIRHY